MHFWTRKCTKCSSGGGSTNPPQTELWELTVLPRSRNWIKRFIFMIIMASDQQSDSKCKSLIDRVRSRSSDVKVMENWYVQISHAFVITVSVFCVVNCPNICSQCCCRLPTLWYLSGGFSNCRFVFRVPISHIVWEIPYFTLRLPPPRRN